MPYFVSEYGGIWWNPAQASDAKAWGYGQRPATLEEFLARFDALNKVLLDNPDICGFCYTQLTDVEQEVNGLYTYDRKAKFDLAVIRRSLTGPGGDGEGVNCFAPEGRLSLAPPFKAGKPGRPYPLVCFFSPSPRRLNVPWVKDRPNTCLGSYAMLCRLRNATNSSSNDRIR